VYWCRTSSGWVGRCRHPVVRTVGMPDQSANQSAHPIQLPARSILPELADQRDTGGYGCSPARLLERCAPHRIEPWNKPFTRPCCRSPLLALQAGAVDGPPRCVTMSASQLSKNTYRKERSCRHESSTLLHGRSVLVRHAARCPEPHQHGVAQSRLVQLRSGCNGQPAHAFFEGTCTSLHTLFRRTLIRSCRSC
jgi:hypothetical protein